MDSMRSLNTSLPKTRKPKPAPQPDTHQSFRTAALTVTNLYKAALADIDRSRSDGYQEALEDFIGLLDKENLGVSGGEGWRIRQWATERLDGGLPGQANSDSDEEIMEEKRARSSSPVMDRNTSPEGTRSSEPPHVENTHRSDSAPPPVQSDDSAPNTEMVPPQGMFHFSSPIIYPSNNAVDSAGPDLAAASRRAFANPRRTSRQARNLQRTATSNLFSLGSGAGQKRKLMQDFFNIDAFNERRDGPGGGGGKRGRMT